MDRRFVIAVALLITSQPLVIGAVALVSLWCVHQWNTPIWPLMLIAFVVWIALSFAAWKCAKRLASGRVAFSLRGMLIGVAVVAVAICTVGRWSLETYRQYQAFSTVDAYGGSVIDIDVRATDSRIWLYRWFGYDPFDGIQNLEVKSDQALATAIEHANNFADIELLSLGGGFTAKGLRLASQFDKFPKLRIAEFMESNIDGDALQHLAKWQNHREIFVNGCPKITDASLRHLVGLPKLESLSLIEEGGGMVITDAGLVHVGQMRNLKSLMLMGFLQVTDAGLSQLHGLAKLEKLLIRRTGATEKGLQELHQALPDCQIVTDVEISGSAGIQKIVIRRLGEPDEPFNEISDPRRIAQIRNVIDQYTEANEQIDDRHREVALPAMLRLDFMGRTRALYEIRLGNNVLQRNRWNQWGKWQLSNEQRSKILELLEYPDDK